MATTVVGLSVKKNENPQATSSDGPPLDFSFKALRTFQELKTQEPRSGVRKQIPLDEEETQKEDTKLKEDDKEALRNEEDKSQKEEGEIEQKDGEEQEQKNKEKKEQKKEEKNQTGPYIIRAYQQAPQTGTNVQTIGGQPKTITGIQDVNLAKQNKKTFIVKLECRSLILSYNKFKELKDFPMIIPFVMNDFQKLQWIDLSHNFLENLDYNFKDCPDLKFLYLHCNYLYDLNQLLQLQELPLRALTIHGNPVETIPNFRLYIMGMLPCLKKLDSVLISKKERDNCSVWMNQFNLVKAPLPQKSNITKPPDDNLQSNQNDVGKSNL